MSWNMPLGCSENDIPENEELAPNQLAEIEFLKKSIKEFNDLKQKFVDEAPHGSFKGWSVIEMIEVLAANCGEIEDYISEPITEDREPNEGEE